MEKSVKKHLEDMLQAISEIEVAENRFFALYMTCLQSLKI